MSTLLQNMDTFYVQLHLLILHCLLPLKTFFNEERASLQTIAKTVLQQITTVKSPKG